MAPHSKQKGPPFVELNFYSYVSHSPPREGIERKKEGIQYEKKRRDGEKVEKKTERQRDRETERQRDRETERQRDRETQTERK